MASTEPRTAAVAALTRPVLLAYDGTDLAGYTIAEAGAHLAARLQATGALPTVNAVVLCVWQPADVGFIPTSPRHFDPASAAEVRQAAEATAAHGASLAEQAGFRARSLAVQAAPIWKGIIAAATEHQASLIVLGSRRRSGLTGHLLGSVAASVSAHAQFPVLLVPPPSGAPTGPVGAFAVTTTGD